MTIETSIWALEQDLPCAPKFVLFRLCDDAGMGRQIDIDRAKLGTKCGLPPDELIDALFELEDRGFIRGNPKQLFDTVELLYPEQDWEIPRSRLGVRYNRTDSRQGWLYVIRTNENLCKVGITTDLPGRMKALSHHPIMGMEIAWSWQTKMVHARQAEKQILAHFGESRFKGEWLRIDADAVVEFAKALAKGGAD